jgi:hypothetical protein
MAIKARHQAVDFWGGPPSFAEPRDEVAWALLKSLGALGGSCGELALRTVARWTDGSKLAFGSKGELFIPQALEAGLGEGPLGQAGAMVAKAVVMSDLARRKAASMGSSNWSAMSFQEVMDGVGEQDVLGEKRTGPQFAQAFKDGLKRSQEAWERHWLWPQEVARFKLKEKLLDGRVLERTEVMEHAAQAFAAWDSRDEALGAEGLAVGRALALAACGLESADVDRGTPEEEPRWRAARKMMSDARHEFVIPEFYGAPPKHPLAERAPLRRPAILGDSLGSRKFERGDGVQYAWSSKVDVQEVFDHPLAAARWICSTQGAGSKWLRTPEIELLNGSDGAVFAWASKTLALYEKEWLGALSGPALASGRNKAL